MPVFSIRGTFSIRRKGLTGKGLDILVKENSRPEFRTNSLK